jgi:hypothetical protein
MKNTKTIKIMEFKTAGEKWFRIYDENGAMELSTKNDFTSRLAACKAVRTMYDSKVWNLKKRHNGFEITI